MTSAKEANRPHESNTRRAQHHATRAERARQLGNYESAIEQFDRALAALDEGRDPLAGEGRGGLRRWSLAHRGVARSAAGEHDGALRDLDAALRGNEQTYAWAWAQKGEVHRSVARDLLQGVGERSLFDEHIHRALAAFEKALEIDPDYTWARAHLAATGVLAHWYARYDDPRRIPAHIDEARILAEFERVRQEEPAYGWSLVMEALFEVIRHEEHRWPAGQPTSTDTTTAHRAHIQKVSAGYTRATELLGDALRAGMPEPLVLRSLALIEAYRLAFDQRSAQKTGEVSGARADSALGGAAGDRLAKSALDLANQLLRADPEDAIAHIVRAAATQRDRSATGRASFRQSVAVLHTLRHRLDAFLARLEEGSELPKPHATPHDLEMAVFHHLLF